MFHSYFLSTNVYKNIFHICRHTLKENRQAYKELRENYDDNILGQVALAIYKYHHKKPTTYVLNEKAQDTFDEINDKYNAQFNLKWSSSQLDATEKSEIPTRSKAPQLIGRLAVILWIYCKGNHIIILVV